MTWKLLPASEMLSLSLAELILFYAHNHSRLCRLHPDFCHHCRRHYCCYYY